MKRFTATFLGTMMVAGFCVMPGCDKKVSKTTETKTSSDGDSKTKVEETVRKADGTIQKTETEVKKEVDHN